MKNSTLFALVLSAMFLISGASSRAENLAEILESAGLGTLIGTWVDQDTNGQAISLTYTWRIEDRVLGLSIKVPGDNSEGLIAVDPESGEVMHVSADENGGVGARPRRGRRCRAAAPPPPHNTARAAEGREPVRGVARAWRARQGCQRR